MGCMKGSYSEGLKMKRKIDLEVDNCFDCPFCFWDDIRECCSCKNETKKIPYNNNLTRVVSFPDWCPLPEVSDNKTV